MKINRGICLWIGLAAVLAMGALPALRPGGPPVEEHPATNGFRRVLADWLWLKANLAWERHDAEQVRQWIGLTIRMDPQTPYFWQNSARMLAYDLPAWRCEEQTMAPAGVQAHWRREGAEEALALLAKGQEWHGRSALLAVEMGGIALYGLGDRERAGRYYGQAAARADAPEYAQRLAELLGTPAVGMAPRE